MARQTNPYRFDSSRPDTGPVTRWRDVDDPRGAVDAAGGLITGGIPGPGVLKIYQPPVGKTIHDIVISFNGATIGDTTWAILGMTNSGVADWVKATYLHSCCVIEGSHRRVDNIAQNSERVHFEGVYDYLVFVCHTVGGAVPAGTSVLIEVDSYNRITANI